VLTRKTASPGALPMVAVWVAVSVSATAETA